MCCIIGLLLPLLTMYINILIIIQCLCGSLENRFHPKFKSLKNRLIIISVGLLSFFFIYLFLRFCLFFSFSFFYLLGYLLVRYLAVIQSSWLNWITLLMLCMEGGSFKILFRKFLLD